MYVFFLIFYDEIYVKFDTWDSLLFSTQHHIGNIVHIGNLVNADHALHTLCFVSVSHFHSLNSCSLYLSPSLTSSVFFKSFHHELLSHIRRWYLPWSNALGLFQTSPTHIKMQTDLHKYSLPHSHVSENFFPGYRPALVS